MAVRPSESSEGLTREILILLGMGVLITATIFMPGLGYVIREINRKKWENLRKRGTLRATIKRLEKQELVGWAERDGEARLTLTEKGKRRVLQYKLDEMELKRPKRWDGLFRVIVFDIPEDQKVARELFRKKLKELGFYGLQKSVFVTPFECKDEIDFLRHTFEIAPHVHYILAKEIPNIDVKIPR